MEVPSSTVGSRLLWSNSVRPTVSTPHNTRSGSNTNVISGGAGMSPRRSSVMPPPPPNGFTRSGSHSHSLPSSHSQQQQQQQQANSHVSSIRRSSVPNNNNYMDSNPHASSSGSLVRFSSPPTPTSAPTNTMMMHSPSHSPPHRTRPAPSRANPPNSHYQHHHHPVSSSSASTSAPSFAERFLVDATTPLDVHRHVEQLRVQLKVQEEKIHSLSAELVRAQQEKERVRLNMEVIIQDAVQKQHAYKSELEDVKRTLEVRDRFDQEERQRNVDDAQHATDAWKERVAQLSGELAQMRLEYDARLLSEREKSNEARVKWHEERRELEETLLSANQHESALLAENELLIAKLNKADLFIQQLSKEAVLHVEKFEELQEEFQAREQRFTKALNQNEVAKWRHVLEVAEKFSRVCERMHRSGHELMCAIKEERDNSNSISVNALHGSQTHHSQNHNSSSNNSHPPPCIPAALQRAVQESLQALTRTLQNNSINNNEEDENETNSENEKSEGASPTAAAAEKVDRAVQTLLQLLQQMERSMLSHCDDVDVASTAVRVVHETTRDAHRGHSDVVLLFESLRREKREMEEEKLRWQEDAERMRSSNEALQRALDETSHVMSEAADLGVERGKRLESLLSENELLASQLLEQEKETSRLRRQIELERDEKKQVENDLEKTSEIIANLRGGQQESESVLNQIRHELENRQQLIEDYAKHIELLEREALAVDSDRVFLRKQYDDSCERYARLQNDLHARDRVEETLRERIRELENKLDRAWRNGGLHGPAGGGSSMLLSHSNPRLSTAATTPTTRLRLNDEDDMREEEKDTEVPTTNGTHATPVAKKDYDVLGGGGGGGGMKGKSPIGWDRMVGQRLKTTSSSSSQSVASWEARFQAILNQRGSSVSATTSPNGKSSYYGSHMGSASRESENATATTTN